MKKDTVKDKTEETAAPEEAVKAAPRENSNEGKIGSMLQDARTKKGLKINEISKSLCIRKSYLEAIESGNYEEIPDFPYGIGFIRSYADYLGLNSARIVQLYKEETDANSRDEKYFVLEPQAEATVPGKKYLLISLISLIAVYFIWFLFNEKQNAAVESEAVVEEISEPVAEVTEFPLNVEDYIPTDDSANQVAKTGAEVAVIDTTIQPAGDNSQIVVNEGNFVDAQGTAPVEKTPAAKPVAEPAVPVSDAKTAAPEKNISNQGIVVKAKQEIWVEVKDGEKLYLSKVLKAGDSYTIPEGKGMILSVGKYEGVDVFVNGKLTEVVKPNKKMNISLDKFLEANH